TLQKGGKPLGINASGDEVTFIQHRFKVSSHLNKGIQLKFHATTYIKFGSTGWQIESLIVKILVINVVLTQRHIPIIKQPQQVAFDSTFLAKCIELCLITYL